MRLLAVCFVVAACGGGSKIEKLIEEGEAFTNRLCACTDVDCVQKVHDELEAWKDTLPKQHEEEAKMSPEEKQKIDARIGAFVVRSKECLAKWKGQYRRRG